MERVRRNLAEKNAYVAQLETQLQIMEGKEAEWRQTVAQLAQEKKTNEALNKAS